MRLAASIAAGIAARVVTRIVAGIVLWSVAVALSPGFAQDKPDSAKPNPAKSDAKSGKKADNNKKADNKKTDKKADKKSNKSKKAPAKEETAAPPAPASAEQKAAYAALPVAERLAIQSDLVWTGDLSGGLDAQFRDRAIAAVKSFQRRNKYEETGILTPEQRQVLAGAMRSRKEYNGWRVVEDAANPGVRLGIPGKLVPQTETGATGSRWTAPRGEIQIETFREKMAGSTLSELFEEMKRRPASRRVETGSLAANSFTLAGLQGLKRFYVRAYLKDNEARGIVILFDQAMEGIMLPMVDIITHSFRPFGDPAGASSARKVEYGSGFVISEQGHIVTERQLTDQCQSLVVAGLGRADRLAEDAAADLALLRVHGAGSLRPLAFSVEPPSSPDLTLIGIAEPGLQDGGREVTAVRATLRGVEGARVLLDGAPARGFVGGIALDGRGHFAGMIDLAPDAAGASGNAALVPAASIRKFLDTAGIAPASGKSDVSAAKEAVVRVICVRK